MSGEISGSHHDEVVTFTAPKDGFADFVGSLLGRPQTITKVLTGAFKITRETVEQIHLLVSQRIKQQNECNFISCAVKVTYSDRTQVEFNALDQFLSHNEIRPLIPIQLEYSCFYLVKFNDKKTPERQEINVSFLVTNISNREFIEYLDEEFIDSLFDMTSSGMCMFEIKHTARSFGSDMENLLTGYISSLIKPNSRFKSWIKKNSGKVGLGSGLLSFASIALAISYIHEKINWLRIESLKSYYEGVRADNLFTNNNVIQLILLTQEHATSRLPSWVSFIAMIGVLLCFLLSLYVSVRASNIVAPGFIVFNETSNEYMRKIQTRQESNLRHIWGSPIAVIALNIISSIIFIKYIESLIK